MRGRTANCRAKARRHEGRSTVKVAGDEGEFHRKKQRKPAKLAGANRVITFQEPAYPALITPYIIDERYLDLLGCRPDLALLHVDLQKHVLNRSRELAVADTAVGRREFEAGYIGRLFELRVRRQGELGGRVGFHARLRLSIKAMERTMNAAAAIADGYQLNQFCKYLTSR